jgi:AraC family transcriptional regulator, positive regulator of tynA and feaB
MKFFKPVPTDDMVSISGDSESWARGLSSVFVELAVEQHDPTQRLTGRMYQYPFGDLTFVRSVTRGGLHRVMRTEKLIQQSTENIFFIGFLLAGDATLTQGDHRAELHVGDIAILDSTRTYEIEVPRSFDALWVKVPRHRLEVRLHSHSDIMAQRIDGSVGIGHVASNLLRAALAEAHCIKPNEANRISNHLLDLLGLCLAGGAKSSPSDNATPYRASTLRRMQEFIEQRLDDEDMSPELVAKTHNVSVRYIGKLFEREGISVARWIRMRRLERCRMDLEDPESAGRSISDIAYAHGFGNISSFNRAFRARFGFAPRSLRNEAEVDGRVTVL